MDDTEILVNTGIEIGLNGAEIREKLNAEEYRAAVQEDIDLAQRFGIRGVPFFVFDRKYAVSGAQESNVFLQTLQNAYKEWKKDNSEATYK